VLHVPVLLLSGLPRAGVFAGLDSGSKNPEPRRPTRQKARWVFFSDQGSEIRDQLVAESRQKKGNWAGDQTETIRFIDYGAAG
jgi:hypothetical protein